MKLLILLILALTTLAANARFVRSDKNLGTIEEPTGQFISQRDYHPVDIDRHAINALRTHRPNMAATGPKPTGRTRRNPTIYVIRGHHPRRGNGHVFGKLG